MQPINMQTVAKTVAMHAQREKQFYETTTSLQ